MTAKWALTCQSTQHSFVIFDVDDPTNPVWKAVRESWANPGAPPNYLNAPWGLCIDGDYIYIASTGDLLTIFDISDPLNPTFISVIGYYHGPGPPNYLDGACAVFVKDGYAYVGTLYSDGLTVFDVSNPAAPSHVGHLAMTAAYDVFVKNNHAYVISKTGDSLNSIDVSDPTNPTLVDTITPSYLTDPRRLFVLGDYAYVAASGSDALTIIDISDPTNLTYKGSIHGAGSPNYLGWCCDVFVRGNYAYVVSGADDSLTVINISDPTNPSLEGVIRGAGNHLENPRGVWLQGDYAYVAAGDSLTIIDISDPSNPSFSGFFQGIGGPPEFFLRPYDVSVKEEAPAPGMAGLNPALVEIVIGV